MTDISRSRAWLESLRPKTLPLAFAAIIVGTTLAWQQGHFDPWVALLALITAGLLQFFLTWRMTMATQSKGAINPIASGRCAACRKG
ncbi:1,4-dihydroxy-2-naphthoate octaprenyltransferase [Klebsiella variicola]|uniref:1,4-dihydroxy-2-naphthoate octaprenyltransferase n=1 Tax=Klebsiella variicola TaxID=244366 RepID=A0A7H4MAN3_KLEVA|nr:1,4-dihydroxy-2-naphthoate octaprenyltransferase [Klebsiella variicola]